MLPPFLASARRAFRGLICLFERLLARSHASTPVQEQTTSVDQDQVAGRRTATARAGLRLHAALKLVMGITLNKLAWQRADQVIPTSRPSSPRERRSEGAKEIRREEAMQVPHSGPAAAVSL
jgi:hypothetical protein